VIDGRKGDCIRGSVVRAFVDSLTSISTAGQRVVNQSTKLTCKILRHFRWLCDVDLEYVLTLKALQVFYPDYVPTTLPLGYWKDKENQKKFFDQLATKWNMKSMDDWNKVTGDMVRVEGGYFIHRYYNGSLHQGTLKCLSVI
jgi:hypothetical protein